MFFLIMVSDFGFRTEGFIPSKHLLELEHMECYKKLTGSMNIRTEV